jgi:diguanylate cyclase (GGDEF)-like protein
MTTPMVPPDCPPWSGWVLDNLQLGLLVLDGESRVAYMNQWLLQHARLQGSAVLGQTVEACFPSMAGSHFMQYLKSALTSGFPVVLSQTLHPAPFPLYQPVAQRNQDKLIRQSIRIIPMPAHVAQVAAQRYTLIQIADVTQTVMRERLLKAQASKLQDLAHQDPLTGLGNRRLLDDKLALELRAAARLGTSLSAVMFDIDYFKQYNDIYGHLSGDEVLRQVGGLLRDICRRPHDVVARFGGEEMVAILPETDRAGATQVATEVLRRVHQMEIPHIGSTSASVLTLSAGVATVKPMLQSTDPQALLTLADQALYAAKAQGRNQVAVDGG